MRRTLFLIMATLLAVLSLSSCKEKKDVLYIYNWSYYTPDEVIEAFEEEYDCEVVMDYFASNEEMFAKLMVTGESSGYDIVFPSSDYVTIMKKLLALLGALMLMFSVFSKSEQTMRKFLLANATIWTVYTAIVGSTAFFTDLVCMISTSSALWKYRNKT